MLPEQSLLLSLLNPHEVEKREPKNGRVFVGTAVAWELEDDVKLDIAKQIYTQLLSESDNMEVLEPEQLVASMNEGVTVVKIGDKNQLLGFAQLSEDEHDPRRIVVGTWLGIRHPDYKNGSGAEVIQHASELAFNSKMFPNTREVIARVRADNVGPQRVLQRIGAEQENIVPIRSPKTKKLVNIYNLTMVGLQRV